MNLQAYLKEPLYKLHYTLGFAGIFLISAGYAARFMTGGADGPIGVLLDTFPNLFGSFGTPFILLIAAAAWRKDMGLLKSLPLFLLLNLLTFAVVLLIEWVHVVLDLGIWDSLDIYASAVGSIAACAAWLVSIRA